MKSASRSSFVPLILGLGLALAVVWDQVVPAVAAPPARPALNPVKRAPKAAPAQGLELRVCATCAYTTVQAALDAANPGDIVKIPTDVYTDVNNHGGLAQAVHISKTLTIQGRLHYR